MDKFRIAEKRGRQATRRMIVAMARYTDRPFFLDHIRLETDEDVWRFFAGQGYNIDALVERLRNKDEQVPLFENLVPPVFNVGGAPGSRIALRGAGEKELSVIEGESGYLVFSAYSSRFNQAAGHLERCVKTMNHEDYLSSLGDGIASIEAYISHRAELYNDAHPPNEKLVDTNQNQTHFETKIKTWIPTMTGGKSIDLGRNKNWSDFMALRRYRHDYTTHPKEHPYGESHSALCQKLNLFRTGIASLLLDLHILFGGGAPSRVVRYAYLPDIEHVVEPEYS